MKTLLFDFETIADACITVSRVIAEGIVVAARQVKLTVPLVVRLEGTNVELGKKILADSGLPIISGNNMADAAQKVVKAVKEAA